MKPERELEHIHVADLEFSTRLLNALQDNGVMNAADCLTVERQAFMKWDGVGVRSWNELSNWQNYNGTKYYAKRHADEAIEELKSALRLVNGMVHDLEDRGVSVNIVNSSNGLVIWRQV